MSASKWICWLCSAILAASILWLICKVAIIHEIVWWLGFTSTGLVGAVAIFALVEAATHEIELAIKARNRRKGINDKKL